jgi:hypothetical protein
MRRIRILFFCLLLTACNLPASTPNQATAPATEPPDQPCAFQWATRSLPELSDRVQQAVQAAGLEGVTGHAEAYGEACSTGNPKLTPSFGAMETDYRFTLKVASLDDRDALGERLERILAILDGFPVGTTPGPQPGYVGVSFVAPQDTLNLWFRRVDSQNALAQGLHGAALLDALTNK